MHNSEKLKIDKLKMAVIDSCNDYMLCINNSNWLEAIRHGETGKQRVEKILKVMSLSDISENPKCLEYVIYSIIISGSPTMQRYITQNVLATGVYSETIVQTASKYNKMSYSDVSTPGGKYKYCIQDIIRKNLAITDNSANELAGYIDNASDLDEEAIRGFFSWLY